MYIFKQLDFTVLFYFFVGRPVMIVIEYMVNGSIKEFLEVSFTMNYMSVL